MQFAIDSHTFFPCLYNDLIVITRYALFESFAKTNGLEYYVLL